MADTYQQVADIYTDLNQPGKSFEYRLLATHLSSRTTPSEWAELGEMALNVERVEEAAACFGKG